MALMRGKRWRGQTKKVGRLRDDTKLFRWYVDRFLYGEADALDEDGMASYLLGWLTNLQKAFNERNPTPCSGLQFMRMANKPNQRCGSPLCPSCWHRRQSSIIRRLQSLKNGLHYYIRSTWNLRWDEDLHPRCLQRFRAKSSAYKLVAYTTNFQADDVVIRPNAAAEDPEFMGQLTYQLMGVFASDRVVRDTGVDQGSTSQINVHEDPKSLESKIVGIVDVERVDSKEELLRTWFKRLQHPWVYRRHDIFRSYLARFDSEWPSGRSWARINQRLPF